MRYSPVYEFHDVGVCNFSQVAGELQKFGDGISWNLMVIPFLGDLEVEAFEKFAMQILKWKKEGHSLYLHGYRHKADLSLKRSLPGRLALRLTNSEAEFAGLSKNDSEMLLHKALQAWQKLNVGGAQGFVAPAWYGSKALFNLCRELGFDNYSSRFIIWNKSTGSRLSLPFSTAGLPKCTIPIVNFCEKIYLRIYGIFGFLPVPRVVKHP
jgi:predicted deacetylase